MLAAGLIAGSVADAQQGSHRQARRPHHGDRARTRAHSAAHPKPNTHYTGTGADFINNTPRWLHEADGQISFKTSGTGRRILDFKGTLSFSCDTASHYVTARYILVKRDGSFAYRFNFPTKLPSGRTYGREYVAIYGRFLGHGNRANVSYFVDAVVPEQHVTRPYETGKPAALGCASWVRGSVKAR